MTSQIIFRPINQKDDALETMAEVLTLSDFLMYSPIFASWWPARLLCGTSLFYCERGLREIKSLDECRRLKSVCWWNNIYLRNCPSSHVVQKWTTAVKKEIFSCWILTCKVFLWVCTILLRVSTGYKRVNCSNKMLCNAQQVNNSALWTSRWTPAVSSWY